MIYMSFIYLLTAAKVISDKDSNLFQWSPSSIFASSASPQVTCDKSPDAFASLENPDLDIDPSVRAQFVDSRYILRENKRPRSNFEELNKAFLPPDFSAPITNIIGGQKATTLMPKTDTRTEFRDRHGNYIDGIDRGKMKKRYEEEWQKRLELREKELLDATKVKRAWDALPEDEKARRRQKLQLNRSLCRLLGAGTSDAPASDIYTWEDIPAIYLQPVDSQRLNDWTSRTTSYSQKGDILSGNYSAQLDDNSSDYIPLSHHRTPLADSPVPLSVERSSSSRNNNRLSRRTIQSSQPSVSSNRRTNSSSTTRAVATTALTSRPSSLSFASTPTGHTSTDTDVTPAIDPGPEVAPIADLTRPPDFTDKRGAKEQFNQIREASTKRGRLVSFLLHEPVKYTSSIIVDRVFGGAVQEIQYFPTDRMAIVCFIYPAEAAALVRHAQNTKESDGHGYRRLQVDIEWYHGVEIEAVRTSLEQLSGSCLMRSRCILRNLRLSPQLSQRKLLGFFLSMGSPRPLLPKSWHTT